MLHTHIVLLKRIHVSALVSSSLLLALSILAFFPVASSFSSTLAAPAPSETTLSMTSENINLDLSVDNPSGTFNASDPSEFSVSTNSQTGYTVNLQASTNNENSSKLISGSYSFNSISSAASSEADFNNGNWGIKPSKIDSTDNINYLPAPNSQGFTIDETSEANQNANTYSISLGAKADYTLPAGRYSNTFVLTAVANSAGYTINYDKFLDDEVENMPASQVVSGSQSSVTLSDQTPSHSYYTFFGWCDGEITTPESDYVCSGDLYQPGDSFSFDANAAESTTLYALWGYSTIKFDANGGDYIDMYDITWDVNGDPTIDLYSPDVRRSGYVFTGWNTKADGTGTSANCTLYDDETSSYIDSCSINTSDLSPTITTLYAQWTNQVTIHFTADYYAEGEMEDQIITIGVPTKLNPFTFISQESVFEYWRSYDSYDLGCENNDECPDEAEITLPNDIERLSITLWSYWVEYVDISYDGNGADYGHMYDRTYVAIGDDLDPNEYEKNDYAFNGWNTKADGSGYTYGQTFTGPMPREKNLTLYAQWRPANLNTIGTGPRTSSYSFEQAYAAAYSANNKTIWVKDNSGDGYHQKEANEDITGKETHYAMQDIALTLNDNGVTRGVCDAVTVENDTIRVLDIRDWKVYWILKAKDGKCWMTQNLDLDLSSERPLTSLDTDLNDASLSGTYSEGYSIQNGIITWTPKKSTSVALTSSNIPNDDSAYEARSTDVGNWYYTDTFQSSTKANYLDGAGSTFFSQMPYAGNQEHGHVGNYYNWPAAIASDNMVFDDYRDKNYYFALSTVSTKAFSNSICPAGWRLPNYSDDDFHEEINNEGSKRDPYLLSQNDFYGLIYHYSNGNITEGGPIEADPVYIVRAGTIRTGGLSNAGYDGYYWMSQRNVVWDTAFNMIVRSSSYDPTNNYSTDRQRSVRCVARNESATNSPYILTVNYNYNYIHVVAEGGSFRLKPFSEVYKQGTELDYADFLGWNTEEDGSGTTYQETELITNLQNDLYLYPLMRE